MTKNLPISNATFELVASNNNNNKISVFVYDYSFVPSVAKISEQFQKSCAMMIAYCEVI